MKLLSKKMSKTYHVYLNNQVLFKDLSDWEFEVIWGRLFHSYYRDEFTYTEISQKPNEKYIEASY